MEPAPGLDAAGPPGHLRVAHQPGARADEQEREQERSEQNPGAGSLLAQKALSLELENNLTEADGATLTGLQCAEQVSGVRFDSELDPRC